MIINSKPNQKAKFNLALTPKSVCKKCRHIKNDDVLDLVFTEQLGSFFFHTTIINVSIHLNIYCIDYSALYTQLNHFYYLTSLTVKFLDPITLKIAYSFLSSIPKLYNSSFDLLVEDEHNHIIMDQVVSSHSRKAHCYAEDNIKNIISHKLLEAVIVFQKNWIFATQFEAYNRNNSYIDESTMTTLMDKYPSNLVVKVLDAVDWWAMWQQGTSSLRFFSSENIYVNCHDDGVKAHFQYPIDIADIDYSESQFSSKIFKNEQYEVILKLLKASQILKNWLYRDRIKSFASIKERLVANKGSKDLIALAKYMCKILYFIGVVLYIDLFMILSTIMLELRSNVSWTVHRINIMFILSRTRYYNNSHAVPKFLFAIYYLCLK
ncbi:uncharacterized protein BX663DRAFT_487462 [Cokeromyces recurvatus]|uniref:uncharacterized protein n=1 Tax=Cokeromyces recurvatus TaxID=90255 RepID=UPI00221FE11D|nr:uncharacterized protein BX663DRAFT_487462 [Cokeromyces recurvatus]KAI7901760.1 hypothetical protein BX663DRAFT_487462 [Cokeromyces recurvatus]